MWMHRTTIATAGLLALLATHAAQAGDIFLPVAGASGVPVASMQEVRFKTVVRQRYDFSCGSAALATLLKYHYNRPTTEEDAFQDMWTVGDQPAIRRNGFSLLDMQRYLKTLGLHADGFRIGLDDLAKVGAPAITLITVKGYKHFVVVKGMKDGRVMIGDPALGLRAIPRDEFETQWQGILFVIRDEMPVAQAHFNLPDEWQALPAAPLSQAVSRNGLSDWGLMIPFLHEF